MRDLQGCVGGTFEVDQQAFVFRLEAVYYKVNSCQANRKDLLKKQERNRRAWRRAKEGLGEQGVKH